MSFEKELIKLFVRYDVKLKEWIRDDKADEFQMLTMNMLNDSELILDYDRDCRLRVAEGMDKKGSIDVAEFRKYFLKGYSGYSQYAGSTDNIQMLLLDYMARHPGHSFELICKATKAYVDMYKHTEYMMKAHNFIMNKEGISTLESAVDDLISENTFTKTNFI